MLGDQAPPYFEEGWFACGLERKVVEASALEHRLGARRLDARNLKGMKDSMRPNLDERVAQALLLEIDRHARIEDALVEADQPVHVRGDECQVMDVVEKLHFQPRAAVISYT